jgi:hypothetical protein
MNPANSNKSKTNIKKEVPVRRQGQSVCFDLVVYPQSVRSFVVYRSFETV